MAKRAEQYLFSYSRGESVWAEGHVSLESSDDGQISLVLKDTRQNLIDRIDFGTASNLVVPRVIAHIEEQYAGYSVSHSPQERCQFIVRGKSHGELVYPGLRSATELFQRSIHNALWTISSPVTV